MKNILLLILLLFAFKNTAQIYGNSSDVPDLSSYGTHQIVWLKIVTGAEDSGFFTHYGIYDHPTFNQTCAIKFAIYSDHETLMDRPQNLLAQDFLSEPTNGIWNEVPLTDQIVLEPSTSYWIGLRFICNYGTGRDNSVNWAEQPLKFYSTWSFYSGWPNPVSNPSSQGNLKNIGLYLVGNDMTLPVDLVSFEVERKRDRAMLSWKTTSEINNDGWNIQRSKNGFSWETIGQVDGNGDASFANVYSFLDNNEHSGMIFYRLEQVDLDGQTAYSDVKSIDMYRSKFTVYPTIIDQYLTVEGIEDDAKYQIYSNSQVVKQGNISRGEKIDVSQLSSGMHYITINGEPLKIIKK